MLWYRKNKRALPWRDVGNAYYTWLSEVILQQTRIAQGTAYYHKFIEAYPTVSDLAAADEQSVLRLWQGLGYYSRARSLHATAQEVAEKHAGVMPTDHATLLKLKGIGPYTAAAIASMAGGQDVATLDGNAYRVFSRLFAIEQDILAPKARAVFEPVANELLPTGEAGDFNQAIMDLGATVCTPKQPLCAQCPVAEFCMARITGRQADFPVKKKKAASKLRYLHFLVLKSEHGIWMKPRTAGGIWQGLWQMPMLVSENDLQWADLSTAAAEIQEEAALLEVFKHELMSATPQQVLPEPKHLLTHQILVPTFYVLEVGNLELEEALKKLDYQLCSMGRVEEVPKPVPIVNWLQKYAHLLA